MWHLCTAFGGHLAGTQRGQGKEWLSTGSIWNPGWSFLVLTGTQRMLGERVLQKKSHPKAPVHHSTWTIWIIFNLMQLRQWSWGPSYSCPSDVPQEMSEHPPLPGVIYPSQGCSSWAAPVLWARPSAHTELVSSDQCCTWRHQEAAGCCRKLALQC